MRDEKGGWKGSSSPQSGPLDVPLIRKTSRSSTLHGDVVDLDPIQRVKLPIEGIPAQEVGRSTCSGVGIGGRADEQTGSVRDAGHADGCALEVGVLIVPKAGFVFDYAETPGGIIGHEHQGIRFIREGRPPHPNTVRVEGRRNGRTGGSHDGTRCAVRHFIVTLVYSSLLTDTPNDGPYSGLRRRSTAA